MHSSNGGRLGEAFNQAMQRYGVGQHAQAEQVLRGIVREDPGHSKALHMLGILALQAGNVPGAVDLILEALRLENTNAGYWSNLGHAYRLMGRLLEAVAACERALSLQPNLAGAHNHLGLAFANQGNLPQAIDSYREAIRHDPQLAAAFNNLGNALHGLGRTDEAVAAFREALRLRPQYAEANNNLGIALKARGDLRTAMMLLRRALEIKPDYAEACNNIGTLHQSVGEYDEALAWFRKSIQLKSDYAQAYYNLGTVHQERGDFEGARTAYERALQLQPGMVEAVANLATILTDKGELEEALGQWRATLRLEPDHAVALFNLSHFATDGLYSFDSMAMDRLRHLAGDEKAAPITRSHYCFTLANLLDRQGAYDEAFPYYRQANDIRKRLLEEQNRGFDARTYEARVSQIIAIFDKSFIQRRGDLGIDSEVPVFVVGMPRSGTTLVEQILASHPQVIGIGEVEEFQRLLGAFAKSVGCLEIDLARSDVLDQTRARKLASAYVARVQRYGPQADRVVDKTLDNTSRLGWISVLFPRARIIHCRRDPLDACMSCYIQNFRDMPFAWSLHDLGTFYRNFERLMNHWHGILPGGMLEVQYEELVANPEVVIGNMLSSCGLKWDARCLAYYDSPRAVRTASKLQVRKPLSRKSIGRWRNYAGHLAELTSALGIVGDVDVRGGSVRDG